MFSVCLHAENSEHLDIYKCQGVQDWKGAVLDKIHTHTSQQYAYDIISSIGSYIFLFRVWPKSCLYVMVCVVLKNAPRYGHRIRVCVLCVCLPTRTGTREMREPSDGVS